VEPEHRFQNIIGDLKRTMQKIIPGTLIDTAS